MSGQHIVEQKCPDCGAIMHFEPASGLYVCEHCGRNVKIEATAEAVREDGAFDFHALKKRALEEKQAAYPVYNCQSCGAEFIAAPEQIALTCPFCKNNIVLTDKVSGGLCPDGIVPFRITSDELPGKVAEFYKRRKLLPKKFFSKSRIGKVTGIYVPFWMFSGKAYGNMTFGGEKSKVYMQGDYRITETSHYDLERSVEVKFENVPVDASKRIDDALMDSLEPFLMSEVKPFDMRYLAGFTADRFDESPDDMENRARKRMENTASAELMAEAGAGYSNVHRKSGYFKFDLDAKYVLMPVYLFDIKHQGHKYSFAVNGQTGQTVGELPHDKHVRRMYFWKHVIYITGIAFLISYILYLLGF